MVFGARTASVVGDEADGEQGHRRREAVRPRQQRRVEHTLVNELEDPGGGEPEEARVDQPVGLPGVGVGLFGHEGLTSRHS